MKLTPPTLLSCQRLEIFILVRGSSPTTCGRLSGGEQETNKGRQICFLRGFDFHVYTGFFREEVRLYNFSRKNTGVQLPQLDWELVRLEEVCTRIGGANAVTGIGLHCYGDSISLDLLYH